MLKIIAESWAANNKILRNALANKDMEYLSYRELVKISFDCIYNIISSNPTVNTKAITEIDNGDYQGTLLFIIPFDDYQPSASDYLMTYVEYGSCSGCDTLLAITNYDTGKPSEVQLNDLMTLCKDILTHTIKPYNYGWRHDEQFCEISEMKN